MQKLFVKDIMTPNPTAIGPEDSVIYAAKLIADGNFNGLPVIDSENKVIGILTEYDLISKGEALHLPTLINILGNIDFYRKDSGLVKDELKKLLLIKVKDIMNPVPLVVRDDAPIQMLAEMFAEHHRVNPIPVIDLTHKLVGVVSRYDLVRFFADRASTPRIEADKPEVLEKKTRDFVADLGQRFVLVSRGRARFWPFVSFLFIIVGFVIAFAIILRIAVKR